MGMGLRVLLMQEDISVGQGRRLSLALEGLIVKNTDTEALVRNRKLSEVRHRQNMRIFMFSLFLVQKCVYLNILLPS